MIPSIVPPALVDRFLLHVDKTSSPSGCWLWTATIGRGGYGYFHPSSRKMVRAHRFAFEIWRGDIPDKMLVCHTCDVPRCVNPDHLWIGTNMDNTQDKIKKGRARYVSAYNPATGDRSGSRLYPERVWRGSDVPQSKLKLPDVIAIRRRYAAGGVTLTALASEYGVSIHAVWAVVHRKSWVHVL